MVGEAESFEARIGHVGQAGPEDLGQGGEGHRPAGQFLELRHIRVLQVIEDLLTNLFVQRRDVRNAARDRVDRTLNRDVQGKGPRFHAGRIGVSPHRQGVPASQSGLGGFCMILRSRVVRWIKFGPQVFSLAKPDRCDVPGFGALAEFSPEHQGEIFSGGHEPFKVGHVEVEVFVVELLEHVRHDVFQVVQVDDHARDGIDLPAKGHFKQVIVSVLLETGAEDPPVALLVPLGFEVPVRSGKFYAFREGRACHAQCEEPGAEEKGQAFRLRERQESWPCEIEVDEVRC